MGKGRPCGGVPLTRSSRIESAHRLCVSGDREHCRKRGAAGRAAAAAAGGRGARRQQRAVDSVVGRNPSYFSTRAEHALINPDNLHILAIT